MPRKAIADSHANSLLIKATKLYIQELGGGGRAVRDCVVRVTMQIAVEGCADAL